MTQRLSLRKERLEAEQHNNIFLVFIKINGKVNYESGSIHIIYQGRKKRDYLKSLFYYMYFLIASK